VETAARQQEPTSDQLFEIIRMYKKQTPKMAITLAFLSLQAAQLLTSWSPE